MSLSPALDSRPEKTSWTTRASDLVRQYRRAGFDVAILMVPDAISILTLTFTSILLARGLGPSRLGAYALVQSVMAVATSLSNLGIGVAAVRYAAMAYSRGDVETHLAVLRWAFRLRMSLVFGVTAILFALAPFLANRVWHVDNLIFPLRLGLLGAFFTALEVIPTVYFQSMRRFGKNTFITVGQSIVTVSGFVYIQLTHRWSVESVLAASLLTAGVGMVLFVGLVPRRAFFPRQWWISDELWTSAFWKGPSIRDSHVAEGIGINSFAFYNFLATIVSLVALRMDVWLMGRYLRTDELGVYSAATRFMVPLQVLTSAITNAITPRAAGCRSLKDTVGLLRSLVVVGSAILALSAGYILIVPSLAPLLFGQAYAASAALGRYLALGQAIALLMAPIGVVGYNLGLVKQYWITNAAQLLVVTIVLLVGLPRLGATAAALAFVVNAATGSLINGYLIYRRATGAGSAAATET